jgi:carbon storage regulator
VTLVESPPEINIAPKNARIPVKIDVPISRVAAETAKTPRFHNRLFWKNSEIREKTGHSCPFASPDQEDHYMLVLSRKTDESIIIDRRITITVLEVRGDKIRLGIDAPKDVPVLREELSINEIATVTAA